MNNELINVPEFIRRTGYKKTQAYETFKNKQLVRLGILKKITPIHKNGGWRIDWQKFVKWSDQNAKMSLNV